MGVCVCECVRVCMGEWKRAAADGRMTSGTNNKISREGMRVERDVVKPCWNMIMTLNTIRTEGRRDVTRERQQQQQQQQHGTRSLNGNLKQNLMLKRSVLVVVWEN